MRNSIAPAAFVLGGLMTAMVVAQEPQVQRRRAYTQANCATCHAVDPAGASPLPAAPPF